MSLPFPYLPRTTYLLTLRCSGRRFLLKPTEEVRQAFLFCLLHAANKYGIELHAFCVLSNHYHLVVSDPDVRLPDFMAWLNAQVARCLNALYGRWECFWTRKPYSRQVLEDDEALLEELVYTITNPVSSKLVHRPEEWPGLVSLPEHIGGAPLEAERPAWYFREGGPVPEVVSGVLTVPPAFEHASAQEFSELLRARVEARISELHEEFSRQKERVLGAEDALAKRIDEAPTTQVARRQLNPRVACKDRDRRVAFLLRLKSFYQEYREAFARFRQGHRDVLFPCGTFWLRVYAAATCHALVPT